MQGNFFYTWSIILHYLIKLWLTRRTRSMIQQFIKPLAFAWMSREYRGFSFFLTFLSTWRGPSKRILPLFHFLNKISSSQKIFEGLYIDIILNDGQLVSIIFFRIVDHKKYRYKNLSKFLCAVNCKHLYSLLFINQNFPSKLPPHLKHANMAFVNAAYRCLVCNASSHSTYKTEKKIFLSFFFIRKLAKTNNCNNGVYNLYIHVYIM